MIVCTHQRRALVLLTLAAIAKQTTPGITVEVIVVADSCNDGTASAIRSQEWPLKVIVLEHNGRNAATSRNLGRELASAPLLLFLDDDVTPCADFIRTHTSAHQIKNLVTVGYCRPVKTLEGDPWHHEVWRWWEDFYHRRLGSSDHRFSFLDIVTGNICMRADFFDSVGRFDETFSTAWEDHEFGLRVLKSGTEVRYLPRAIADHRFGTTFDSSLVRRRQEGRASIQIGRAHPELRNVVFLSLLEHPESRMTKWAMGIAQHRSADTTINRLKRFGQVQAIRLPRRQHAALELARAIRFWQGVFDEVGSERELRSWMQDAPAKPTLATTAPTVSFDALLRLPPDDLVEAHAPGVDQGGIRVSHFGAELFVVHPDPTFEALRVRHLIAIGRTRFVASFSEVEVMGGLIEPPSLASDRRGVVV